MMAVARDLRQGGHQIALAPTMGALHEGHLTLMGAAREMCDTLIVSIFVNPTQFGPNEDFTRYPRDIARDAEVAFGKGVDLIFAPSVEDMYPDGFSTYITVEELSDKLEGASRPGHFRGVATVVAKLLNVIQPRFAFFGRKDAQQVIVLKRMIRDLAMDVEIVVVPTVREEDGLALSSRNLYLSQAERKAAPVLHNALERCRVLYNSGERDSTRLIGAMKSLIETEPLARIDYVEITDTVSLNRLESVPLGLPVLVSLAVYIGATRLIDNIVLNGEI